jgi:excisionase family DNA binding protein
MAVQDTQQVSPSWQSELLTVDEVAAVFKVTRRTVWRWADAGHLERIRFGRLTRYRREDIERLAKTGVAPAE